MLITSATQSRSSLSATQSHLSLPAPSHTCSIRQHISAASRGATSRTNPTHVLAVPSDELTYSPNSVPNHSVFWLHGCILYGSIIPCEVVLQFKNPRGLGVGEVGRRQAQHHCRGRCCCHYSCCCCVATAVAVATATIVSKPRESAILSRRLCDKIRWAAIIWLAWITIMSQIQEQSGNNARPSGT
jgi:hypothetical protein